MMTLSEFEEFVPPTIFMRGIDYYNDNNSEHLFNKLLALIQEKKITIYKLSQELNLNYLTIYNWVNKGKKPRIKTLVLIRKYFQQIT